MTPIKNGYFEDDIYVQVAPLCAMIGVSSMQITNYVKDGLPFVHLNDSKMRSFPIRKCFEWLMLNGFMDIKYDKPTETEEDLEELPPKERKDLADARLKELELAKKKGELISLDEIRKECEYILTSFKNKTLGVPSKIAPALIGIETIAETKAILDEAMFELLTELSKLEDM